MSCLISPSGSASLATQFAAKYALGTKLGCGAFSEVRVATCTVSADAVSQEKAVKIMDLRLTNRFGENYISDVKLHAAQKEAMIWKEVSQHQNIVQQQDVFIGVGTHLSFMVMERCHSLVSYFLNMPLATEREFGKTFAQMLAGIAHVHSFRVVHCDIKPENFMLGSDGVTVKLCDFGLAMRLKRKKTALAIRGTPPFMCPEMVKCTGYDEKADVWSFGVLVYTLLFGTLPYKPSQQESKAKDRNEGIMKAIVKGIPPLFKPIVGLQSEFHTEVHEMSYFRTAVAVSFVESLLTRAPQQRPSALAALHMKYMVASSNHCHGQGIVLPTLRPMIQLAEKEGIFGVRREAHQKDRTGHLLRSIGLIDDTTCDNLEVHQNEITTGKLPTMPSTRAPSTNLGESLDWPSVIGK